MISRQSALLICAAWLWAGPALAADKMTVATAGNASDAALYIAKDRGYFTKENLDIEYVPIDSLSRMIAPLGQGKTRFRPALHPRLCARRARLQRAIKDGRFSDSPKAAAMVKILAGNLKLKEEQVRKVWPAATDPDARPHLPSLQRSLAFFKEHGLVKDQKLQVENVLDMSFVDAAVKDLGVYVKAGD